MMQKIVYCLVLCTVLIEVVHSEPDQSPARRITDAISTRVSPSCREELLEIVGAAQVAAFTLLGWIGKIVLTIPELVHCITQGNGIMTCGAHAALSVVMIPALIMYGLNMAFIMFITGMWGVVTECMLGKALLEGASLLV